MALRELLLKLNIDIDREGEKKAGSALNGIKKAAIAVGAIFATGKLAQGVGQLLELASAASETSNVINTAFGEMAGSVESWAEVQAKKMGRSRFELREMAAETGAMVSPMLDSEEAAADMSMQMAQLAVDLGSFFNVNDPDALGALKAGLIGSSEPMLKFGVVMKQANLQAFALRQGIQKNVKDMTEGEKVQLRFNFIMDQTRKAQGDAAETLDGYANSTKALKAALKDSLTTLGKEFLPAAEELLAVLIPLARMSGKVLVRAFQFLKRVFAGISMGIDTLNSKVEGLGTILAVVVAGATAMGAAMLFAGKQAVLAAIKTGAAWVIANAPLMLMIGLIGIIVAVIALLIEDFVALGEGGESVTGTIVQGLQDLFDEFGNWGDVVKEILATTFAFWFDTSRDTFDAIGGRIIDFFDGIMKFADAFIGGVINAFMSLYTFVTDIFTKGVGDAFTGLWDNIKFTFSEMLDDILGGISKISGIFSFGSSADASGGNVAGVSPSAAAPAAAGGASNSVSQQNNINVQVDASGQGDPEAVGQAVARAVAAENERRDRKLVQAYSEAVP